MRNDRLHGTSWKAGLNFRENSDGSLVYVVETWEWYYSVSVRVVRGNKVLYSIEKYYDIRWMWLVGLGLSDAGRCGINMDE